MPISVQCRCGKQLTVKSEAAGRTVKCPKCGGALKVPQRPAMSAPTGKDLAEAHRVVAALREELRPQPDKPGWNEVTLGMTAAKRVLSRRYSLVALGAAAVVAVIVGLSQGGLELSLGLGIGVGLFYFLPVSADLALAGAPRKPEQALGAFYGAIALGRMELAHALLLPCAKAVDRSRGAWPPLGLEASTESFASVEGFSRYWAPINRESLASVIGTLVGMSVEKEITVVDQCRLVDEPDFVIVAAILETRLIKTKRTGPTALTTWTRKGAAFTIQPLSLLDGRWYFGRGTFLSDEEWALAPLLRGKAAWGEMVADAARELRASLGPHSPA